MAIAGSLTYDTKLDTKGFDNGISDIDKKTSKLQRAMSTVGTEFKKAFEIGTVAVGATATALVGLGTASTKAYSGLEQNIGGVETLFKSSSQTVIDNANNAYKTAGMSANQYMETVTSFSASLLQGLNGDTAKAAKIADTAIIDMSDNANKMGTDMSLIQNAYQGFAKQNYTMLDNLKLGYGGTQAEMARLINDSGVLGNTMKVTANNVNQVSFDKMIEAIHVVQTRMDITGTTAKEAATTISGSITSMKASWENFLSGDFDIGKLLETTNTAMNNIINASSRLIYDMVESISEWIPYIIETVNNIINKVVGILMDNLPNFLECITEILQEILQALIDIAPQLLECIMQVIIQLVQFILSNLPQIVEIIMQLLTQIIQAVADFAPQLISMLPTIIQGIIDGILNNLGPLLEAGMQLLMALAEGILGAIPQLISMLPQIIETILNAILDALPQVLEMGIEILLALVERFNTSHTTISSNTTRNY